MATAAPHVKLLRQLASAKDDYLSGAFDISWDGAKATLYLVFGRPSHAVFETDEAQIEGEAAIDALLAALPRVFFVSDWRRAMSPHETLSITIDELAGPFVRLAGSYADDPVTEENPEWWSAADDSPDLPFGLADFPLLPGGRPLWVESSPEDVHLADRLSELPPSILILTGAKLRAAAVVSGGDLIDAVWIDADDHARGETAGMALLGATKGSLAGYALDDPRVAEALTMLWRLPRAVSGVELSWLDPASMLAAFRADGLDRVLVIDAPVRGIALFSRGGLVAVYSETQRSAVASPERLRSLLSQARGRLTVMERKPRPLGAEVTPQAASAHAFFDLAPAEPETSDSAIAVETAAPGSGDHSEVEVAAEAEPDVVAAPNAEADVDETSVPAAETETAAAAVALADAPADAEPAWGLRASEADTAAPAGEVSIDLAAPPPPPHDDHPAGEASEAPPPPPPAPEASKSEAKPKRSRWGFGRSRKSRAERHAAEAAAALPDPSSEPGEAATFAGWSVRQPNADPQPVWLRSHDSAGTAPPDAATDAALDEAAPVAADDATEPAAMHEGALEPEAAPAGLEAHDEPAASEAPDTAAHAFEFVPLAAPTSTDESGSTAGPVVSDEGGLEASSADELVSAGEHPAQEERDSDSWLSPSWLDDVVSGDAPPAATEAPAAPENDVAAESIESDQPDAAPVPEAAGTDDAGEWPQPGTVARTPGPWSWPLAEPDEDAHAPAGATSAPHAFDENDAADLEPAPVGAPAQESASSALESDAEPGFFHRDEPLGSQYVDFDEVRNELVQIGIVWLGETNAVQVTALLSSTRSTIDDFVATIDTIRGLHLDGQDPASIQAMAREMHQQAAERLCGA